MLVGFTRLWCVLINSAPWYKSITFPQISQKNPKSSQRLKGCVIFISLQTVLSSFKMFINSHNSCSIVLIIPSYKKRIHKLQLIFKQSKKLLYYIRCKSVYCSVVYCQGTPTITNRVWCSHKAYGRPTNGALLFALPGDRVGMREDAEGKNRGMRYRAFNPHVE